MGENPRQFETVLVHGGLEPGPGGATAVPIVQSNAFAKATAEELENQFRGRAAGPIYTRMGNPTTAALERRLALLEGGGAALATASGMAAIATAVLTILRAGDEIVSSSSLFGGTYSLFRDTLPEYGISTRFVDPLDLDGVRAAVMDRTRLVFVETIGNPKLDVPDVPALAEIARAAGVADHRAAGKAIERMEKRMRGEAKLQQIASLVRKAMSYVGTPIVTTNRPR